jgi:hypothetical protein
MINGHSGGQGGLGDPIHHGVHVAGRQRRGAHNPLGLGA